MKKALHLYQDTLNQILAEDLYKKERTIMTPQGVIIATRESGEVLNFCANNYLGLEIWIWYGFCPIYLRDSGYS